MAYEESKFGYADGSNVNGTVNNHFGARAVGGSAGEVRTDGLYSEYKINVDETGLPKTLPIGKGVLVKEIVSDFATGAITTLTVGGVDISGADGSAINDVELASSNTGAIVLAGPTAGSVVIRYLKAPAA